MPHPFTDVTLLTDTNADRFRRESFSQRETVNLPDIPAVRAEITAMLDNAERPAPPPVRPTRFTISSDSFI